MALLPAAAFLFLGLTVFAPSQRPFSLLAIDPCETTVLPPTGKNAKCLTMSQSCVDAFGQDFECRWVQPQSDYCNCVVKPAPTGD